MDTSLLTVIVSIVVVAGLVALYVWLSVLVGKAAERKGRSKGAWVAIALIFGIIVPAVIVAIMGPNKPTQVVVTAPTAAPTGRKCPYCAEDIQPGAIKCKHCGEMLNTA